MVQSRLKYHRRNPFNSILSSISFVVFRWPYRIHLYIFTIVLLVACYVSYRQPFGLLFNLIHIGPERAWITPIRRQLIIQQKEQQKQAYDWLEHLWQHSIQYPELISNRTGQSRFFDYIQPVSKRAKNQTFSRMYKLFEEPNRLIATTNNRSTDEERIVISILYGNQETDHQYGKFYVGQVLRHLLKYHHPRFIITLCENNNTNDASSISIELIRRLVPVFIVTSSSTDLFEDIYEREKQAHLQCILANFESFPSVNYFLLLQDDAEPIGEDFLNRFLFLIENRFKRQWPPNGNRQQPAFVKIYHPRWLIGYLHPSIYIIVQLLATSFLLTFLSYACFHVYRTFTQKNSNITNSAIWWQYYDDRSFSGFLRFIYRFISIHVNGIYFISYFLLITCVLILLDHSNVAWSWRSLHPSLYAIYPAPSCCLPGVLFFRQTYIQVTDYLNQIKCHQNYAIDTAFDDLPRRTHLQTLLVEPNLVHHIGLYSRLRHAYINPYLLD